MSEKLCEALVITSDLVLHGQQHRNLDHFAESTDMIEIREIMMMKHEVDGMLRGMQHDCHDVSKV